MFPNVPDNNCKENIYPKVTEGPNFLDTILRTDLQMGTNLRTYQHLAQSVYFVRKPQGLFI